MSKILCFIDNLGSGGAQRQMVNIAVLLKSKGVDVSFVVYGRQDFYKHILNKEEIPVHCIDADSPLKRICKVYSYLKRSDADTVITFMETPNFLACLAKALGAKWRLVTSERSAKEETFRGLKQAIYNWFERFSDAKMCNSYNAKRLWEKHYPQYADKLSVIYNAVIINDEFAKQRVLENKPLRLVIAASYQQLKNPIGVVEALRLLTSEERKKIHIDWYGRKEVTTGNSLVWSKAQNLIRQYGIEESITLNDATKEIYKHMYNADTVGLFSTVEGLPNIVCEGMALGKPIIMTRVSDYEVLTNGNGISCNPDAASIADALRQFIDLAPSVREEMGHKSREKAKSLFSQETVVNQWIEICKKD